MMSTLAPLWKLRQESSSAALEWRTAFPTRELCKCDETASAVDSSAQNTTAFLELETNFRTTSVSESSLDRSQLPSSTPFRISSRSDNSSRNEFSPDADASRCKLAWIFDKGAYHAEVDTDQFTRSFSVSCAKGEGMQTPVLQH